MEQYEEDALSRENKKDVNEPEVSLRQLVPADNTMYQPDTFVLGEVGVLQPEKTEALMESLGQTATCLYEDLDELVECDGYDYMRKIMRQHHSCIVTGENGSGKSCATILAEYDLEEEMENLEVIVTHDDVWGIYKEIWHALDRPIPPVDEIVGPSLVRRGRRRIIFPCANCQRHCTLYATNFDLRPEKEDILYSLYVEIEGKCPLIRDMAYSQLRKLEGNIFVIRIPDIDDELITLLTQLLAIGEVIILANPEQAKTLRKYTRFNKLPVRRFPKPPPSFFYELVKKRMESSNLSKIPFTMRALNCAIVLCKHNPGKFIQLLSQTLEESLLDEEPRVVDIESVFYTVAATLDEKTMIEITLMKFNGWTKVKLIKAAIEEIFDFDIDGKRLGRILSSDMNLEKRSNPDSEYLIPATHTLPDITKVTKVTKDNLLLST
ncbi:hypothetical protein ACFLTV_00790 [Chloroflexota bacterium]